ncbi:MAG: ABC transporter permease [Opitutae bacterium]|nr:ABC transporter permease [Opitutae bacterium]
MMLSHKIWQTRFGGRDDVVGTTIRLGGAAYQVIGVLPPLGRPFAEVDGVVGKPLELSDATPQQIQNGVGYFEIYARLRPGVTLEQANEELRTIAANDAREQPARADAENVNAYHEVIDDVAGDLRPAFYALLGAVVAVLLIACANNSLHRRRTTGAAGGAARSRGDDDDRAMGGGWRSGRGARSSGVAGGDASSRGERRSAAGDFVFLHVGFSARAGDGRAAPRGGGVVAWVGRCDGGLAGDPQLVGRCAGF